MVSLYKLITKIIGTVPTAKGTKLTRQQYGQVRYCDFGSCWCFFQSSELCRGMIWPSVDYAVKGAQARTSYCAEAGVIWSMIS